MRFRRFQKRNRTVCRAAVGGYDKPGCGALPIRAKGLLIETLIREFQFENRERGNGLTTINVESGGLRQKEKPFLFAIQCE